MLNKIFRPKWQNRNPEIRRLSIETIAPDDIDLLKNIALSDNDNQVRLGAFARMTELDSLLDIYNGTSFDNDKRHFARHIAQQIDCQHQKHGIPAKLLHSLKTHELLTDIILHSTNDSIIDQVIDTIDKESLYLDVLYVAQTNKLKQKLASRLTQEAYLRSAYAFTKNKDKSITKILKLKLDNLKHNSKQIQQHKDKAEALLNKLQLLNNETSTAHVKGELIIAENTWRTIDTSNLAQVFIETITQALSDLAERSEKIDLSNTNKANLQKQANIVKARQVSLENNLAQLSSRIYTSDGKDHEQLKKDTGIAQDDLNELANMTENTSDKLQTSINQCYNNIQQQQQMMVALANFDALMMTDKQRPSMNTIMKAQAELKPLLNTAKSNLPASPLVARIESALNTLDNEIRNLHDKTDKLNKKIDGLISDIDAYIHDKQLQAAEKAFQQVKRFSKGLNNQQHEQYSQIFKRLTKQIQELSDWRRFSTEPIRHEICQKMEALITSGDDANKKARRIKQLQDQWHSLGYTEDQSLWLKFQDLSKKAFTPCQEAFDKEKEKRAFNAKQRTQICEETERFLATIDWQTADYKSLDKLLQKILNEWKRFSAIDRNEHQALHNRFSQSIDLIKKQVIAHKRDNLNKLEHLCKQASDLLRDDDVLSAVERYKTLMTEWKTVGLTFRKEQEEKWLEFRNIGNQLHEKMTGIKAAKKEQQQTTIEKAETLIKDIQQMACRLKQSPYNDIDQERQKFHELVAIFKNLDGMPEWAFKKLNHSFKAACKQYYHAIDIHKQHQWFTQLSLFETVIAKITPNDNNDFNPGWLPEDMPVEWQQRFLKSYPEHSNDHESNLINARELCIKMEMLCGKASPKSDAEIKMALQIKTLKNNFGSTKTTMTVFEEIEQLYFLWFSQPIKILMDNKDLSERFMDTAKTYITAQLQRSQ